jgi:peptide/nickel transport system permease protein
MFERDDVSRDEVLDGVATRKRNWPLILGLALVAFVLLLAVAGPSLAPKDPREQKLIIQVNGEWRTPPYPAFTPGYPLGSDNLGRDLYSWLLWSVRPTMILVLVVALLRMVLGVVVGVVAGWSEGFWARLSDGLISAALAAPALIASLIVITAVGFRLGIWAFVVGLAVTGWAETAQLVREQTRTIKAQQAVEASRALGSSAAQTFFLHILPHVMPMVWMLLAFEISNTLVTTAGLGFLGYYLGGAVFTEVDDFVYQRISEMPELGQMLATAWMVLDEPWAMVAAGSVVFLIVLGFNLIGEGLQQRLTRRIGGPRALYTGIAGAVLPRLDDWIGAPLARLARRPAFRAGMAVLLIMALTGVVVWWRAQQPPAPATPTEVAEPTEAAGMPGVAGTATPTLNATPPPALAIPGGHVYANVGGDPWHTHALAFSGPATSTVRWSFEHEDGFVGGPVIDSQGVLYVPARTVTSEGVEQGVVYALDAAGEVLWETPVLSEPVGTPALGPDGTLYVADKGGVHALSPEGEVQWRFMPADGRAAVAGPVVGPEGGVYFKSFSGLLALEASGDLRWQTTFTESATALAPHLSPDGEAVFWQDVALATADGTPYAWGAAGSPGGDLSQVVVGADGELYLRYGVRMVDAAHRELVFDWSPHTWGGEDAGVTPAGRPWLSARPPAGGMGLGFYWGAPDGTLSGEIGVVRMRDVQVVGVDQEQIVYLCAGSYQAYAGCLAVDPELPNRARWRTWFRPSETLAGAALAPGRLYVATRDGRLLALGAERAAAVTPTAEPDATAEITITTPTPAPLVDPGPAWPRPEVPGGHPWASVHRDPWGTHWIAGQGPATADVAWTFEAEKGLAGSPAVAAAGTVYVNTLDGQLVALSPDGAALWRAKLSGRGVGGPALGADGTVYVTDWGGYLFAFTPQGELRWRYHPTGEVERPVGTSGEMQPIPLDALGPASTGPVVAPTGDIYYGLAVDTQMVQEAVHLRWEVMVGATPEGEDALGPDAHPYIQSEWETPWLLPGGEYIIFNRSVRGTDGTYPRGYVSHWQEIQAAYGRRIDIHVFSGANGRTYVGYRRILETGFLTADGFGVVDTVDLTEEKALGAVVRAGATPEGMRWMFFGGGKFVWIDTAGQMVGPVSFPLESTLIAVDGDAAAYGCGSSMGRAPECMAYAVGAAEPRWHVTLAEDETVQGGAVVPGAMYVVTDRQLYALRQGP